MTGKYQLHLSPMQLSHVHMVCKVAYADISLAEISQATLWASVWFTHHILRAWAIPMDNAVLNAGRQALCMKMFRAHAAMYTLCVLIPKHTQLSRVLASTEMKGGSCVCIKALLAFLRPHQGNWPKKGGREVWLSVLFTIPADNAIQAERQTRWWPEYAWTMSHGIKESQFPSSQLNYSGMSVGKTSCNVFLSVSRDIKMLNWNCEYRILGIRKTNWCSQQRISSNN